GRVALALVGSELLHRANRHAGLPQAGQHVDPAEIVPVVAPVTALVPVDRLEQVDALVVAQRVLADAGDLRGFPYGQCIVPGHDPTLEVRARSKSSVEISLLVLSALAVYREALGDHCGGSRTIVRDVVTG